jgi:hypothetical protein
MDIAVCLFGPGTPGFPWFGFPLEDREDETRFCIVPGCLPLARKGFHWNGYMLMRVVDGSTQAYKNEHPEWYFDAPRGFAWIDVQHLDPMFSQAEF